MRSLDYDCVAFRQYLHEVLSQHTETAGPEYKVGFFMSGERCKPFPGFSHKPDSVKGTEKGSRFM